MVKLLDSTGLSRLWEKIKASFVSINGGTIKVSDKSSGLLFEDKDSNYVSKVSPDGFSSTKRNDSGVLSYSFRVDDGNMRLNSISIWDGTSSQALIADGSVKTINAANGICGLDANGRIPLAQLGNLDTSLFKLVTSLPSSGESNKIYIVKDGSDANDVYQEYYYTNGAWEKIGTHAVKVDLTPYAKKSEAVKTIEVVNDMTTSDSQDIVLQCVLADGNTIYSNAFPLASPRIQSSSEGGIVIRPSAGQHGLMSATDKAKLDGIAEGANNYTLPTASASALGGILLGFSSGGRDYAVQLDESGKAYVNVPWTDTQVTVDDEMNGDSTNPVQNKAVTDTVNLLYDLILGLNTNIDELRYRVITSDEIDAILV